VVVGAWGWQGLGVVAGVLALAMLAAILAAERMGRISDRTSSTG
jgi:hypothetical protein